jgi:hypothetical protein
MPPANGRRKASPAVIEMTPEIKKKVDEMWKKAGL